MPNYMNNHFSGQGRIKIGTYAVDIGKPASNALIRIMPQGTGNKVLRKL